MSSEPPRIKTTALTHNEEYCTVAIHNPLTGSEADIQTLANPRILRVLREVGTSACRLQETHRRQQVEGWCGSSLCDNDVAVVMEVDDVAMRTGDDETSTGWCFAVASMCAADSGSDEHLCTPKFADSIYTSRDHSPFRLKDVQQNDLVISGQKTVPMLVGPTGGKHAMDATATFRVAEVRDNILSLGKLVREGFSFTLGPRGCSMEKGRQESAALPGTKQLTCGSSCVAACIETSIRGGGNRCCG